MHLLQNHSFLPTVIPEEPFFKNSEARSKIESLILYPCDSGVAPGISFAFKRSKVTHCEGKYCLPPAKQKSDEAQQPYTLCRRSKCDIKFDDRFEKAPFYKVIKRLYGAVVEQLHQNDQYLRTVAALNRWNEIIDRLHCSTCEKPLSLSEHAKGTVGKMAYSASYWHCANEGCETFCESIKITYCYGCNKVIDSRNDTQSCNPWEVKSYKKFYICSHCAACCKKHDGFSGRCPNCGVDKAYIAVDKKQNTKAKCRQCSHQVSIDKGRFERFNKQKHLVAGAWSRTRLSTAPSSLIFPERLINPDSRALVVHDWQWGQPILYVYDLFECLKTGLVSIEQLEKYPQIYSAGRERPTPGIYDLKILDRLVNLGVNHRKYRGKAPEKGGFLSVLDGISNKAAIPASAEQIAAYITNLFNSTRPEVWEHYNEIEWPFMRALFSLCEKGLTVDQATVNQVFAHSERARNVLVENLRNRGIETPDQESLVQYVEANYGSQEKFSVSRAIQRADYKGFIDTDPLCAVMHNIEKIERGASVCKALVQHPHAFIPDYQIVGSDTVRCTSRNPNLLGLPKELRSIIKAASGYGIVECDYSQMEVGVIAALSEDQQMIDDYNSGDVYERFAEPLALEREQAKLLFLSILYGVSNQTLSHWLGCTKEDTEFLVRRFFQRYRQVAVYQQHLVEQGKTKGYVETKSGLKRWVNQQAYRAANNREEIESWQTNWFKNFPVQASAAIIFKKAIIDIASNLPFEGFKLVAPMYDSIAFEAPLDRLDASTQLVCSAMKRAMKSHFPELSPYVKVNNHDTSCWNAGPGVPDYQQWLEDIISSSNNPDFWHDRMDRRFVSCSMN